MDPSCLPDDIRDGLALIGYWHCDASLRGKLTHWDGLDERDARVIENDLRLMGTALAR